MPGGEGDDAVETPFPVPEIKYQLFPSSSQAKLTSTSFLSFVCIGSNPYRRWMVCLTACVGALSTATAPRSSLWLLKANTTSSTLVSTRAFWLTLKFRLVLATLSSPFFHVFKDQSFIMIQDF